MVALRRAVLDAASRFGERVGYLVLDKRAGLHRPRPRGLLDGGAAAAPAARALPRGRRRRDGHGPRLPLPGHRGRAARPEPRRHRVPDERRPHGGARHRLPRAATRCAWWATRRLETYLEHIRDFAPAILINDLPALDAAYLTRAQPPRRHHREPGGHPRRPGDDRALRAGDRLRDEPGPRDARGFYGGPAYAILREQFRGREKEVREQPRLVLLSFGGSDPQGLTLKAARALAGPRPRGGAGGRGRPRLLLPRASSRRSCRALRRPRPAHQRGRRPHRGADAGGGRDGRLGRDVRLRDRRPGHARHHPRPERARGPAHARVRAHGTVEYLGLGTEVDEAALAAAVRALLARRPRGGGP